MSGNNAPNKLVGRAVILTALPVEYEAVRSHLVDLREETHPRGTVYERGRFEINEGYWEVCIAEIGAGGDGAAMEAERAIQHFNPTVAIFVGVAGGLKDVSLGDVVAATKVYGYESGKDKTTFLPRPDVGNSSYLMEQRARAEARASDWLVRLRSTLPDPKPRVFVGPIAAGEKVVASTRSSVYRFLRHSYSDALAVEMEGRGFLTATHANQQVQALVVRGVSDLIKNKNKSDAQGFQAVAARHASAFAFEVLANLVQQSSSKESENINWEMVLSTTINNIDKPRMEAIVEHVRQITGDEKLVVLWVKTGSVILTFDGSRSGFERIEYLFRTGQLTTVAGVEIKNVSSQPGRELNAASVREHQEPSIWNVPHRRNPNFTGREELLADLREKLTSGKHTALTQAIYGLGGVGKTQLATEYAYRHAGDYDVVWWVRSEDAATLASDYAGLAGRLGLPEKEAREQEVVVEAVRNWLEGAQRWLLVFDNANGPEEVNRYLPRVVNGHVIITSRNPNWGRIAKPLQVKVLEADKGAEFLLNKTRQKDEASARKLSEELGGLPLALAQAGAYIEANGVTIKHYLELFQPRRKELWGVETGPLDYDKRTVGTTLSLAVNQVEAEAPAGLDFLRLCAFLGPDDIPRSMLRDGKEYLPVRLGKTVADDIKMNTAIGTLRRYSLVEVDVDRGNLSVHRLVQAVMRDGLAEDESKVWAEAAVDVVNEAFPFESDDVRTWGECARLLPHALAATGHVEELGIASGRAGRLLNMVGNYLSGRAQYVEAKTVLQRSLPIMSKVHGEEHPEYAAALNNLGGVLQDMGDLAGAKEHYERALAIDEQAFGPLHPTVATDVNNLGLVLQDMGDLQGAKEHYERALAIDEQAFSPNHPNLATLTNNLAVVLKDMGDLQGAKAHLERALVIDEQAFGPDHPNLAIDVNNLGMVLKGMGDLQGAKAHLERALVIDEQVFGPDHPNVAIRVNNLGSVLKDMGDLEGAKAYLERALRIFRYYLGDEHPYTIGVGQNLLGVVLLHANEASDGV